jgi:choline-sulfatase
MPNIVVLMSDEHNPLVSSVYGHPAVATPHMERLARRGTLFASAYCASPLCLPSRSAFLSGRPVHQLQTYNNCNIFAFDYPGYGRVLREQGVHTVHLGKTDVWTGAEGLGFSEMLLPVDREVPGDAAVRRKPLAVRAEAAKRASGYGPAGDAFESDTRIVDRAVEWLERSAPGLDGPWTLCVNIESPHFPHYVTRELWDLYPEGGDLPSPGPDCETARHPYAQDLRRHFECDLFTEEQVRGLRRGYLGCVTFVDRQIGRLLDVLESGGLLEDTVFVYTSDHGEMLGRFGMWWKCSLYEDSVRIPMVAAGPGFAEAKVVRAPVSLFDLHATLFEAVGRSRPRGCWGTSLQRVCESAERAVFSEYHGHGVRSGAFMVRKGRWKLLYNMEAPHQLFDLERDPQELENMLDREPGVFRELSRELRRFCCPEAENERAEAFVRRQLEAMESRGGGGARAAGSPAACRYSG